MVFSFPDAQTRNLAGREVRKEGFDCTGAGPSSTNHYAFLTVDEPLAPRRALVAELIRKTTPAASRLQ